MTYWPARPACPKCDMAMVATEGFDQEQENQTFECLRCSHVEAPQTISQHRPQAGIGCRNQKEHSIS
jgi:lysyl-tRNA synthetase class I